MKSFSVVWIVKRISHRKIFGVLWVLASVLSISQAVVSLETKDASSATVYFSRGLDYFKKGMYEKAIAEYTMAIEINPKYALAYSKRGSAYGKIGQYGRAISDYSKAIEIDPGLVSPHYSRGLTYFERGQYDQAISDFTEVVRKRPGYADAYYYRGNAYLATGQLDLAVSDHTKVIEIKPANYKAYNSRGSTYLQQGHDDHALRDFNKVLQLNVKYPNAYLGRAIAYYNKGEYEKALDDVRKAEELGFPVEPEVVKRLSTGKQESQQSTRSDLIAEDSRQEIKRLSERIDKRAKASADINQLQAAWDLGTRWTIAALYYAIGKGEKARFPLAGARKLARQIGAEIPDFPTIEGTETGIVTMLRYINSNREPISSRINSAYGTQAAAYFDLATTANVLRSVYEDGDTKLREQLVENIKKTGAESELPKNLWQPVVSKAEANAPIEDFNQVTVDMHVRVREHFEAREQ